MAYRSERFPAGELKGLEQTWKVIDSMEATGLPVRTEVMAGTSYRRQLHANTQAEIGDVNYLLQAVLQVPTRTDGKRITARYFVDEAKKILGELDLPGEPTLDEGGLHGLDPSTTKLAFGSTGTTEKDLLWIYAPWVSTRWSEAGKQCMAVCGIEPPQPKGFLEEHPVQWDERVMRHGLVVFQATPNGLETY